MQDSIIPEGSRLIPLSKGQFAIVDEADFEWLNQWSWYLGTKGYAGRDQGRNKSEKRRYIRMHTLITCPPPGMVTDHLNGNKLDNRRSNLRICTQAKNTRNSKPHSDSKSGFRGVSWHGLTDKWQARVSINGKEKYLGLYDTREEAALAYNQAAKIHYGEFARLNVISDCQKSAFQ